MKMLFIVFISTFLSWQCLAGSNCAANLELAPPKMSHTDQFVSYLSLLLERQVIQEKHIVTLRASLETGGLSNPIDVQESNIRSEALVHFAEVQRYIESGQLDRERLRTWSSDFLSSRDHVRVSREDVKQKTASVFRAIEFLPVPQRKPSHFVSNFFKRIALRLKRIEPSTSEMSGPIEMMSTPVTQSQWVEVMKSNPSHYLFGPTQTDAYIDGTVIKMKPDHPVENVTWWSAVIFANKLSEWAGLKPVYDLSEVTFTGGTSAEQGDLVGNAWKVKINAPQGNIYLAEGYRLPTKAEFFHVANHAKGDVLSHAWLVDNSKQHTHAVAQLLPIVIDGKNFYDLIGNVSEWGHEELYLYDMSYNTVPRDLRSHRRAYGNDYYSLHFQGYDVREHLGYFRDRYIGFRLVRSLKK